MQQLVNRTAHDRQCAAGGGHGSPARRPKLATGAAGHSRRGGRVRWISQLPGFEDEEDQEDPILWSGPVLAGDRLLVGSSDEQIWSVSPYTGKILGRIDVSGPVLISPVVARETVYVLTDEADLIAFR